MCRTFGLRKYSRVPGGGVSRRSSRYDFSMATPATGITPNPMSVVANTAFNSSGSNARFLPSHPSNGTIRFNNGGTNSIKCVAIVTNDKNSTNSNSSSNAIVMLPFRDSTIHREEPLLVQNFDIDNKVLEENLIDSNVAENNLIESNVTENNLIDSNITENNAKDNNITESMENIVKDNIVLENRVKDNNVIENSKVERNDENNTFENNVVEKDMLENNVVENNVVENNVEVSQVSQPARDSNKSNNGRSLKDNSDEDNSEDPIVTSCLIENFTEKKNAIFV